MSEAPRISLVTPTFNRAATIRETIESVLGQDYPNLDYMVVDAGSEDGTMEILREYETDSRFRWISEPDQGQSDAINKGLARATGEVFNWINSDDYLEAGALRVVADIFASDPQLDIVTGETAEFRGRPPQVFNRTRLALRSTAEATIPVGVCCQPSTFWRTQIIRALGGVEPSLHYVMDWDLWVRYLGLYGHSKIGRTDRLLAYYRHHPESKSSAHSSEFYEEARQVFHELLLAVRAPDCYLRLDGTSAFAGTPRHLALAEEFDRDRYLGAYAERKVRIHRGDNPALARQWLGQAFAHRPYVTPWRLKMALRLLFR